VQVSVASTRQYKELTRNGPGSIVVVYFGFETAKFVIQQTVRGVGFSSDTVCRLMQPVKFVIQQTVRGNVKYLNDMRWVRQNTTLYYDVSCHRTDNMFRPFTIRPSSGLTSKAKEEIVKL
jgi:hypothetical protein